MSLLLIRHGALRLAGIMLVCAFAAQAQAQDAAVAATPTPEASTTATPQATIAPQLRADAWAPSKVATGSDIVVLEGKALQAVRARNVADLLREVAGISIQENSGTTHGIQGVSIRGSTPEEVVIILDGQRLVDNLRGAYDLSLLGVDQIERLEVVRGGASAAYGADAVGGVVYISTRKSAKSGLRISVENQSFMPQLNLLGIILNNSIDLMPLISAQHAGVSGSFNLGETKLSLYGGFDRDMGLFSYTDATGALVKNQQTPTMGGNAGFGLEVPLGESVLHLNLNGLLKRTGNGGTTLAATPNLFHDDTGVGGSLGWNTGHFISQDLSFDSQLWGNWSQLKFSTGPTSNLLSGGIDLKQTAKLSDLFGLNYGISVRYDNAQSDLLASGATGYQTRVSGGAFLSPILKTGVLTMSPTVRLDLFTDMPVGVSAALNTDIALSNMFDLWLTFDHSYRVPAFLDTYLQALYIPFLGIPQLEPESSWSGDFGLAIKGDVLSSRSSIFVRYVENGIRWYPISTFYVPLNVDVALYPGFDQDFSLSLSWFRAGLTYEYLHSYYLGAGNTVLSDKRVALVPDHRLRARVGLKVAGFELGVNGELNSNSFWDFANSQPVAAYFLLNANLAIWFSETSNFYIEVDNILNTVYQTTQYFPTPGINARIGLILNM